MDAEIAGRGIYDEHGLNLDDIMKNFSAKCFKDYLVLCVDSDSGQYILELKLQVYDGRLVYSTNQICSDDKGSLHSFAFVGHGVVQLVDQKCIRISGKQVPPFWRFKEVEWTLSSQKTNGKGPSRALHDFTHYDGPLAYREAVVTAILADLGLQGSIHILLNLENRFGFLWEFRVLIKQCEYSYLQCQPSNRCCNQYSYCCHKTWYGKCTGHCWVCTAQCPDDCYWRTGIRTCGSVITRNKITMTQSEVLAFDITASLPASGSFRPETFALVPRQLWSVGSSVAGISFTVALTVGGTGQVLANADGPTGGLRAAVKIQQDRTEGAEYLDGLLFAIDAPSAPTVAVLTHPDACSSPSNASITVRLRPVYQITISAQCSLDVAYDQTFSLTVSRAVPLHLRQVYPKSSLLKLHD